MTNSHNRTNSHQAETSGVPQTAGSNTSGRFFANNTSGSNASKHSKANGSAKKQQQQSFNASLNSSGGRGGAYFQNQSQEGQKYFSENSNDKFFVPLKTGSMAATSTPGKQQRSSPQHIRSSPTASHVLAALSSSPPNLSHFAGSKCYDAPAPNALPKPPRHWTGGQDVVMTMPVAPSMVIPAAVSPKQKPQQQATYYQQQKNSSSNKGAAGKMNVSARKHVNNHRQTTHPVHHPMVVSSCSREFLRTTVSGDYDKFSENLKMVLNVRA